MPSGTPKKPENFFVNLNGNSAILVWDKVIKDTEQNYIQVDGYYVATTTNPNAINFKPLATILTSDSFMDKDVFYINYTTDNLLYQVCPFIGSVIGECATSIGIITSGSISAPTAGQWDVGQWDVALWG